MDKDLFTEILIALEGEDAQAIARIYVETLKGLRKWEQEYLTLNSSTSTLKAVRHWTSRS